MQATFVSVFTQPATQSVEATSREISRTFQRIVKFIILCFIKFGNVYKPFLAHKIAVPKLLTRDINKKFSQAITFVKFLCNKTFFRFNHKRGET